MLKGFASVVIVVMLGIFTGWLKGRADERGKQVERSAAMDAVMWQSGWLEGFRTAMETRNRNEEIVLDAPMAAGLRAAGR